MSNTEPSTGHQPSNRLSPEVVLAELLEASGLHSSASQVFTLWPRIEAMCLRYARFVTPLVPSLDGGCLLSQTLTNSLTGLEQRLSKDFHAGMCGLVGTLSDVEALCSYRISVREDQAAWQIWQYDQPLLDLLLRSSQNSIQVQRRELPLNPGPVRLKLLSSMCEAAELEFVGVGVTTVGSSR